METKISNAASRVYNALTDASKAFVGDKQYQMQSTASVILTPSLTASKLDMTSLWNGYDEAFANLQTTLTKMAFSNFQKIHKEMMA